MKRLGVVANCGKPDAAAVLGRLAACAARHGLSLVGDAPTARLLGRSAEVEDDLPAMARTVDAVMALGGDGTLLSTVRRMGPALPPVIGVNIGSLGFMTSVAQQDVERAVEHLVRGDVIYSERIVADVHCRRAHGGDRSFRALNDAVLSRGMSVRVVTLRLEIDGEPVTSYVCDGLIVSTPTGSTGHSLSAGGPILVPGLAALVVSLICPHALGSRPLVVADRSVITVTVEDCAQDVILSVDGQSGLALQCGDRIVVTRAPDPVRLIHLPGHSHFDVMRRKLGWRGSVI